jgi:hypothetical protein
MTPDEARAAVEASNKLRADRLEANENARIIQEAADLVAYETLADEFGEENLSRLNLPYTAGCPTFLVVRTPTAGEAKRYRDQVKPKDFSKAPDTVAPAELLAAACRVYPLRDEAGNALYKLAGDKRPGVYTQLGMLALALAQGREADEGKG